MDISWSMSNHSFSHFPGHYQLLFYRPQCASQLNRKEFKYVLLSKEALFWLIKSMEMRVLHLRKQLRLQVGKTFKSHLGKAPCRVLQWSIFHNSINSEILEGSLYILSKVKQDYHFQHRLWHKLLNSILNAVAVCSCTYIFHVWQCFPLINETIAARHCF